MLFYKAVYPKTLELLEELQQIDVFKDLRLVGGTALALQIGHRMSDDIDLFGLIKADKISIFEALKEIGNIATINNTENIHIYTINEIKVDIVNYPYPWLEGALKKNGLRIASLKDIAAMKLAAITGRGTKKDFIDIYFLLKQFSLDQLLSFYSQKYADGSFFQVLKSLSYFDDANQDIAPRMLIPVEWEKIKDVIKTALVDYANN